jgi:hypothetical protein
VLIARILEMISSRLTDFRIVDRLRLSELGEVLRVANVPLSLPQLVCATRMLLPK